MITAHTTAMSTTRNLVLRMNDLGVSRFHVLIDGGIPSGAEVDVYTGGVLLGMGVGGLGMSVACGIEELGMGVIGEV